MDSSPELLIKFYCKRGSMGNFIKEAKSGFDFAAVSSSSEIVNTNRFQIHALDTCAGLQPVQLVQAVRTSGINAKQHGGHRPTYAD